MKRSDSMVFSGGRHYASQALMPAVLVERLRRHAWKYGETYSSHLALQANREYYWTSNLSGVVAFRRVGRYVHVADGLLAKVDDRESLLGDFLAFAEKNRWVTSFVNVPRNEIKMYRRLGCQVSKCGEEALVQLDHTDWRGKEMQWLRRQENYCRRHGVEVCEINPDLSDPMYRDEIVPQLEEISQEHISSTLHQREMQFFVSDFSADELRDRRLFAARDGSRIIAFIVCNPGLDGNFWAVEVYRRRRDAIRGVIPYLIMHAMRVIKSEGVQYFSLSLSPFLRCNPVVDDSRIFRFVANTWWRHMNSIYDVQGIYHFKSRFRPDYREMFIAVQPQVTIRSLLVIAYVWKVFHFNPLRLLKRARWTKQRSLAVPERRSKRLIRQLQYRRDREKSTEWQGHQLRKNTPHTSRLPLVAHERCT